MPLRIRIPPLPRGPGRESPGGDGRNGTRAQGSIPPRTLHAQSPRHLRVVDPPAGRRHVLLRNHEVRAGYVGQAVRGLGIDAHGERPGETGLRHPGREMVRRQGFNRAGTSSSSRGPSRTSGTSQAQGSASRRPCSGKDNEALAEKAAFAGNLLDEASLRQMDRAGIEGVMSNRFGEGNVNREIPTDKALPFMVVFFDPPGRSKPSW